MSPYEEDVLPLNYTARSTPRPRVLCSHMCEHTLEIASHTQDRLGMLTTSYNANDLIVTRSADGT